MNINPDTMNALMGQLDETMQARVDKTVDAIVSAKESGGKVAVVTGSGPNIHEGVTTLIAELMRVGVIDGVTTSSATVSHELGGTLDKVKRCNGRTVGVDSFFLPRGDDFELTEMDPHTEAQIEAHMPVEYSLMEALRKAEGKTIIKAAGNLGYPVGLWIEHLSWEIMNLARSYGASFEEIAGLGCDERTMLGIGARKGLPVMVTIPQLIGGGMTGLCIGDSISLTERATRLARMLSGADVIIESGVALTQEIHDGPFERYTGHGLWSAWHGHFSYSLEGKTLVRFDLDPALEQVYQAEQEGSAVQQAIADGQPKTKLFKVPFRMEMSGFARHEGSIPVIGDIGVIWPLVAWKLQDRLGLDLQFMSYPQQTSEGQAMREAIVKDVLPINREKMLQKLQRYTTNNPCRWNSEEATPLPGSFLGQ